MKFSMFSLTLCFVFAFTLVLGCKGAKKPEGFPDVVPHAIVVKNNGSPEDKVTIMLVPEGTSGSWIAGGTTDATGRAALGTSQGSYTKLGVPVGKFKVVLNKTLRPAGEKNEEEYLKMSQEERDAYGKEMEEEMKKLGKIIPDSLSSSAKTTLTIDVSGSNAETVIEITDYK